MTNPRSRSREPHQYDRRFKKQKKHVEGRQAITTQQQRLEALLKWDGDELTIKALFADIEDNIPREKEARNILRLLTAQLSPLYLNADIIKDSVRNNVKSSVEDGTLDKTDVGYDAFLRIWQVLSYLFANDNNSDASNPNSSFDRAMSHPSVPYLLSIATILPIAIGVYMVIQQMREERKRCSVDYQIKQIKKVNPETRVSPDNLTHHYNRLLNKGKVAPLVPAAQKVSSRMSRFIERIEKTHTVKAIKNLMSSLSVTAFIFWPVWVIGMLVVGIASAGLFPALPIIMGVTIGISLIYQITMHYIRRRANERAIKNDMGDEVKNMSPEKQEHTRITSKYALEAAHDEADELSRMRCELAQRQNMKEEHLYFNSLFQPNKHLERSPIGNRPAPAYLAKRTMQDGVIVFVKNPKAATPVPVLATPSDEEVATIQQSAIFKHLTGSKHARRIHLLTRVAFDVIGKYTLTAFILWLLSSTIAAISFFVVGPLATAFMFVAELVGSGWATAAVGALAGIVSGTRAYFTAKDAEVNAINYVQARLAEKYMGKLDGLRDHDLNKQRVFEIYEKRVNHIKDDPEFLAHLLAEKKRILLRMKKLGRKSLSKQDTFILAYDTKGIDVYNDHYFRSQEKKAPAYVILKDKLYNFYKTINAAQTGIFIVRTLILAGAVLGSLFVMGPIGFMVIASIFAVTVGILKLMQLYVDSRASKAEFFVNTFDTRIKYLKTQHEELSVLKAHLANKQALAPKETDDEKPSSSFNAAYVYLLGKKFKEAMTSLQVPTEELSDTASDALDKKSLTKSCAGMFSRRSVEQTVSNVTAEANRGATCSA